MDSPRFRSRVHRTIHVTAIGAMLSSGTLAGPVGVGPDLEPAGFMLLAPGTVAPGEALLTTLVDLGIMAVWPTQYRTRIRAAFSHRRQGRQRVMD